MAKIKVNRRIFNWSNFLVCAFLGLTSVFGTLVIILCGLCLIINTEAWRFVEVIYGWLVITILTVAAFLFLVSNQFSKVVEEEQEEDPATAIGRIEHRLDNMHENWIGLGNITSDMVEKLEARVSTLEKRKVNKHGKR